MKDLPDLDIIEACKRGERTAFNEFMRRHHQRVFDVCRRMVGDVDDATDLAQETFVRAWQGLSSFRGDAQVFTWLYRIATNLSLNHLRTRRVRSMLRLDDVHPAAASVSAAEAPELEAEALTALIDKAIQRLPDKQRTVFVLRYYEEMPYEEMSRLLKKTVGGLKANYFHAVRKVEEFVRHAL
jgi:RNA polymerase sigma factor (sigma-70 family)